jgi:hypothetical protein
LGEQAIAHLRGLRGYIGVDMVLGKAADGSQDYAIEINPRLTTSYIGLRAACLDNLARSMIELASGRQVDPLRWKPGVFQFWADGTWTTPVSLEKKLGFRTTFFRKEAYTAISHLGRTGMARKPWTEVGVLGRMKRTISSMSLVTGHNVPCLSSQAYHVGLSPVRFNSETHLWGDA